MKRYLILIFIFFIFFILPFKISTQSKYIVYTDKAVIDKSREILYNQVGVKERTGRNDGEDVEKYLKSVGRFRGDAWCQALQYYCYKTAVDILGLDKTMIPIPRSGVANDVYNYAAKKNIKVKFSAELDDFLIWRQQGSTYKGHIARIIGVSTRGWVTTIEGNTSNGLSGSQSEGNGCFQRKRNLNHPLGKLYVRGLVGVRPLNNKFAVEKEIILFGGIGYLPSFFYDKIGS